MKGRVIGRLFEFDKQVEVAIGSILAASDGTEYIQPLDRESLAIRRNSIFYQLNVHALNIASICITCQDGNAGLTL